MQHLEVSGAVRPLVIVRRQKVNINLLQSLLLHALQENQLF